MPVGTSNYIWLFWQKTKKTNSQNKRAYIFLYVLNQAKKLENESD